MGPNPGCRRAPLSITKRSIAVQFFIRHFRVIRGSPCKNEQEHEHEYEFVPCIRLHSLLKNKN